VSISKGIRGKIRDGKGQDRKQRHENLGKRTQINTCHRFIADVADNEKISVSAIIAQLSPLASVADTTLSATQFSAIMTPISPTHIGDNFGFKKTNGPSHSC